MLASFLQNNQCLLSIIFTTLPPYTFSFIILVEVLLCITLYVVFLPHIKLFLPFLFSGKYYAYFSRTCLFFSPWIIYILIFPQFRMYLRPSIDNRKQFVKSDKFILKCNGQTIAFFFDIFFFFFFNFFIPILKSMNLSDVKHLALTQKPYTNSSFHFAIRLSTKYYACTLAFCQIGYLAYL